MQSIISSDCTKNGTIEIIIPITNIILRSCSIYGWSMLRRKHPLDSQSEATNEHIHLLLSEAASNFYFFLAHPLCYNELNHSHVLWHAERNGVRCSDVRKWKQLRGQSWHPPNLLAVQSQAKVMLAQIGCSLVSTFVTTCRTEVESMGPFKLYYILNVKWTKSDVPAVYACEYATIRSTMTARWRCMLHAAQLFEEKCHRSPSAINRTENTVIINQQQNAQYLQAGDEATTDITFVRDHQHHHHHHQARNSDIANHKIVITMQRLGAELREKWTIFGNWDE